MIRVDKKVVMMGTFFTFVLFFSTSAFKEVAVVKKCDGATELWTIITLSGDLMKIMKNILEFFIFE